MKKVFSLQFILAICYNGFCQESRMIDQIKNQKSGTSVWWAGQLDNKVGR